MFSFKILLGPSLFWWSKKKKDELLKFWENYILIMEVLEGNQVCVSPVLVNFIACGPFPGIHGMAGLRKHGRGLCFLA